MRLKLAELNNNSQNFTSKQIYSLARRHLGVVFNIRKLASCTSKTASISERHARQQHECSKRQLNQVTNTNDRDMASSKRTRLPSAVALLYEV
jgi:hypothetical protein